MQIPSFVLAEMRRLSHLVALGRDQAFHVTLALANREKLQGVSTGLPDAQGAITLGLSPTPILCEEIAAVDSSSYLLSRDFETPSVVCGAAYGHRPIFICAYALRGIYNLLRNQSLGSHSESVVPDLEYQPSHRILPLQHYLRFLLLSTESKQRAKHFMTTQFPSFDFQSGLESLKAWFSVLNEMEQTTTLCVLAQQSGISQLLGLIDTVAALLELEKAKLAGAKPKLSTVTGGILSNEPLRDGYQRVRDLSHRADHSLAPAYKLQLQVPTISRTINHPPNSMHAPGFNPDPAPLSPPTIHSSTVQSNTLINHLLPIQMPSNPSLALQKANMAHLCHLVLGPHFTRVDTTSHNERRRKRKVPKYPIDDKDPDWLYKWLKHLRLHKYEPSLNDLGREELLDLDEEALFKRGIDTLGARSKLLAAFREAKEQCERREKAADVTESGVVDAQDALGKLQQSEPGVQNSYSEESLTWSQSRPFSAWA